MPIYYIQYKYTGLVIDLWVGKAPGDNLTKVDIIFEKAKVETCEWVHVFFCDWFKGWRGVTVTFTRLCVLSVDLRRRFDILLWLQRAEQDSCYSTKASKCSVWSLFRMNHTDLISRITLPSPLHDLLEALCRSDREISALVFQLDCELSVTFWTLYRWYFSLFGLTFFLSRRSCSSFWKCFSLSMRWRSASSRAFASASSLWNKEDTNMKQI